MLNGIANIDEALQVATHIHQEFVAPFYVNHHEIVTSASIGIALSEAGYTQSKQLLRDANTALHRAKAHGKGRSEVFDCGIQMQVLQLVQLEAELRSAIWHEVLQLHYQPIVSAQSSVETAAQAAFLLQAECEAIQGYLASRPVPTDAVTLLLQNKRSLLPSENSSSK